MNVTVNGEQVDLNLVDELFMQKKAAAEIQTEVSCCERNDEFQEEALEEAIDRLLLFQESENRLPEIPADRLREELEKITKLYRENGASWEMLEAQKSSFKAQAKSDIRLDDYMNDLFSVLEGKPSNEDLEAYYQEHQEEYFQPRAVRCLHLCKFPNEGESAHSQYETMCSLRAKALEGTDFEVLAKEETERHDKRVDMGYIELQTVTSNFDAMLFSMEAEEISPVFYEEGAYHLIKIVGVQEEKSKSFEEVKQQLKENWLAVKKKEILQQEAKRLRERAEIVRGDR